MESYNRHEDKSPQPLYTTSKGECISRAKKYTMHMIEMHNGDVVMYMHIYQFYVQQTTIRFRAICDHSVTLFMVILVSHKVCEIPLNCVAIYAHTRECKGMYWSGIYW